MKTSVFLKHSCAQRSVPRSGSGFQNRAVTEVILITTYQSVYSNCCPGTEGQLLPRIRNVRCFGILPFVNAAFHCFGSYCYSADARRLNTENLFLPHSFCFCIHSTYDMRLSYAVPCVNSGTRLRPLKYAYRPFFSRCESWLRAIKKRQRKLSACPQSTPVTNPLITKLHTCNCVL